MFRRAQKEEKEGRESLVFCFCFLKAKQGYLRCGCHVDARITLNDILDLYLIFKFPWQCPSCHTGQATNEFKYDKIKNYNYEEETQSQTFFASSNTHSMSWNIKNIIRLAELYVKEDLVRSKWYKCSPPPHSMSFCTYIFSGHTVHQIIVFPPKKEGTLTTMFLNFSDTGYLEANKAFVQFHLIHAH